MGKLIEQSDADQTREAGMFYPTGYIVSGHESQQDAEAAARNLLGAAFGNKDVTVVTAGDMVEQAGRNLEHPAFFAAMGASIAVRQKQYDLAKEGCAFLLIHAPEDEREEAAVGALSKGPVRYAVKYRSLVIENLLPKIPTANPDPEPARAR